jgi:hypothetical protein
MTMVTLKLVYGGQLWGLILLFSTNRNFGLKSTLIIIKNVFSYHIFIKLFFFLKQYNHKQWKWQESFQCFLHQFTFELN